MEALKAIPQQVVGKFNELTHKPDQRQLKNGERRIRCYAGT